MESGDSVGTAPGSTGAVAVRLGAANDRRPAPLLLFAAGCRPHRCSAHLVSGGPMSLMSAQLSMSSMAKRRFCLSFFWGHLPAPTAREKVGKKKNWESKCWATRRIQPLFRPHPPPFLHSTGAWTGSSRVRQRARDDSAFPPHCATPDQHVTAADHCAGSKPLSWREIERANRLFSSFLLSPFLSFFFLLLLLFFLLF